MHVLRHPRNALLVGVVFAVIAIIYVGVPIVFGGVVDVAGFVMLLGLGMAMSLMAYVLAAGSPRGD